MRRTGLSRMWIVWVGGVEDHYQTKKEAQDAAKAWREQAPKLGIHPDMHVKKSEREALGFFEEDRFV